MQPGLGHPGGQGVAHAVPAREGREQGRMGVEDPAREGAVDRLGHHRAEAGHGDQVDLVGHQGGRHGGGEALPVEVGAEAAVGGPVDQLGGDAVLLGQPRAAQGRSERTDGDREPAVEHGPQDRPGTRDEDRETHGVNLMRGRLTLGGPRARVDPQSDSDLWMVSQAGTPDTRTAASSRGHPSRRRNRGVSKPSKLHRGISLERRVRCLWQQ